MRRGALTFILIAFYLLGYTQKRSTAETVIQEHELFAHLSFLAADEMRGRNAGSNELDIAANYVRTFFRMYGLQTLPGAQDYFQPVTLVKNLPFKTGNATLSDQSFRFKENLLVLDGDSIDWVGELVYVGYGSREELDQASIKGKMVLALAGSKEADNMSKVMSVSAEKRTTVQKAGGVGLIELLVLPQAPWPALVNYLGQVQWGIKKQSIPHVWLKPQDLASLNLRVGSTYPGKLVLSKRQQVVVQGKNVVGVIEGSDASLKDEYVLVTAHYDHVGVQKQKDQSDSIFNGARDNAVGTVALIQVAKLLSQNKPKRSVVLIALTSEEKGLLGSQWYVENPLVPLNKTVLAVNCDGVGYNDKTRLTSISWGRTSTDDVVSKAASAYGLSVGGDPDPREGFFERSDQVSFARKGVVAIKLQPGLAQMDDEIRKYYHRPADEVSSLDMKYLTNFYKAFVTAVVNLANDRKRPSWNKGDRYEAISTELYGGGK